MTPKTKTRTFVGLIVVSALIGFILFARWMDRQDQEYWQQFSLEQAQELVQKEPNNPSAHAVLGMHWWSRKEYEKATNQFRQEASLDPHDYSTHLHIAQILEDQGKTQAARKEWQITAELAPDGSVDKIEAESKR